jgi:hypothetical protein
VSPLEVAAESKREKRKRRGRENPEECENLDYNEETETRLVMEAFEAEKRKETPYEPPKTIEIDP